MENFPLLLHFINYFGYWALAFGVFAESMGIPCPGETILVLAGAVASQGYLDIKLVIIITIFAAVIGDNVGYFLGRKFGKKVIEKLQHYSFFSREKFQRAEVFFKKHGDKTVFVGRFIAILRTYVAFLSGVFELHYPIFLLYNFMGAVFWALIFGFLGFWIGTNFSFIAKILKDFKEIILAIFSLFILGILLRSFLKKKK